MSSNNESGCGKTIGILAGIATIIGTIFVVLTFLKPTNQNDHQSNGQSPSEAPSNVATTFQATNTFLPPPTLYPTEPPLPDTASGTILEFGQTWRQQGLEITLTDKTLLVSNVEGAGVGFHISIFNFKPFDIAVTLSMNNVTAIDNLSRQLKISHICNDGGCWISCETETDVLASGEKFDFCSAGLFFASVNISDSSIQEIIVTFSNANIGEARWRIQIYH